MPNVSKTSFKSFESVDLEAPAAPSIGDPVRISKNEHEWPVTWGAGDSDGTPITGLREGRVALVDDTPDFDSSSVTEADAEALPGAQVQKFTLTPADVSKVQPVRFNTVPGNKYVIFASASD